MISILMQEYKNFSVASGSKIRFFRSAFGILHIFSELGTSDTLQAWIAFV